MALKKSEKENITVEEIQNLIYVKDVVDLVDSKLKEKK